MSYLKNLPAGIEKSEELKEAWMNILGKGDKLHSLRRALKQQGLCDNDGVSALIFA